MSKASKVAFLPRYQRGTRNVTARPNRKIIFGAGNWYYPRSRFSVGVWALETYAKKRNLAWEDDQEIYGASIDLPDVALVRPSTYYVEENGRSYSAAAQAFRIPFDRCIVIHHNEERELGDLELHFGGKTVQNAALRNIFDLTGTENFPRLSIGVGHPESKMAQARYLPTWSWSDNHFREWFLMNKFPVKERMIMRQVVLPRVMEMIDFALSVDARENYFQHRPMTFEQAEEELYKLRGTKDIPDEDPDDAVALIREANARSSVKISAAAIPDSLRGQ